MIERRGCESDNKSKSIIPPTIEEARAAVAEGIEMLRMLKRVQSCDKELQNVVIGPGCCSRQLDHHFLCINLKNICSYD